MYECKMLFAYGRIYGTRLIGGSWKPCSSEVKKTRHLMINTCGGGLAYWLARWLRLTKLINVGPG